MYQYIPFGIIWHKSKLVHFPGLNYDVLTREYNVSCTVGKAVILQNFNEVLEQYEPMISASIRKLNIYRDFDFFRQSGRIALWHAWKRFDEKKGNFTPYAYRSIRGAMLDELKNETHFAENIMPIKDDLLDFVNQQEAPVAWEWSDFLTKAFEQLKPGEQELVKWLYIDHLSLGECAAIAGISIAGIKKRRERVLAKLRTILQG